MDRLSFVTTEQLRIRSIGSRICYLEKKLYSTTVINNKFFDIIRYPGQVNLAQICKQTIITITRNSKFLEKDTTLAKMISPGAKLSYILTLSFSVARTSSCLRVARKGRDRVTSPMHLISHMHCRGFTTRTLAVTMSPGDGTMLCSLRLCTSTALTCKNKKINIQASTQLLEMLKLIRQICMYLIYQT